MNNELYHHGIKGQKWGRRRWQNEDGTLTEEGKKRYGYGYDYDKGLTIDKDRYITRVSFNDKETNTGRTYASFKKEDVDKYVNNGKMLADLLGSDIYKYTFKTAEKLVTPSRKEMVDMYIDMIKDQNPKILQKGRLKQEKAFDKFQYSLVKRNKESERYFEYVRNKGYNALMDTADMKQKISDLPIIVIDRGQSLVLDSIEKI